MVGADVFEGVGLSVYPCVALMAWGIYIAGRVLQDVAQICDFLLVCAISAYIKTPWTREKVVPQPGGLVPQPGDWFPSWNQLGSSLPMVFLKFFYSFPTFFLRFSYNCPIVLLQFSCGFPIVFLVVFLWFSYGFLMVLQWFSIVFQLFS